MNEKSECAFKVNFEEKTIDCIEYQIPIIDYDTSMGEYQLSQSAKTERASLSLEEQLVRYYVSVHEWDNGYDGVFISDHWLRSDKNKSYPIFSNMFGGLFHWKNYTGRCNSNHTAIWDDGNLSFVNKGIIVDGNLIVGLETDNRVFLLGETYEAHGYQYDPILTDRLCAESYFVLEAEIIWKE